MKGIVILTAVVTLTSAQVSFPGAEESIGGSSNSKDVDSQLHSVLSTLNRNSIPSQSTKEDSCNVQCSLPDGSIGICIPITQCSSYSNITLSVDDQSNLNYLRARVCRLLTNIAHVCCPVVHEPAVPLQEVSSGSQNPLFPSDCGQSFALTQRVIQGSEVEVGAYPWLVALGRTFFGNFHVICGGTLITRRHVLSAAHCFDKKNIFIPTHALVGEHNVTSDNDGANPQTYRIGHNISPGHNNDTRQNDITLLTLDRDVILNTNIHPICLPFRSDLRNKNFVGNQMDIVGWGRTNHAVRATSKVPLEGTVEVVTLDCCQEAYGSLQRPLLITEKQLCAGTGGVDTCRGDSGGPLNYLDQQTGRYYLAGVTSFGLECGRSDFPGVYTRVGSYLNWIETNVN